MRWPNPIKTSELSNVVCKRLAKTINPLQVRTVEHHDQHYEDVRVSEDILENAESGSRTPNHP